MSVRSRVVALPEPVRAVLTRWDRARKTSKDLAQRSRILLLSAEGMPNKDQAALLGVDVQRIRRWRNRWCDSSEQVLAAVVGEASEKEVAGLLMDLLADSPRSGTPPKFTPEQVTAIIQLACEDPQDSDIPLSHWTPPTLAKEAARRGVVESISPRHVDRLLKSGRASATPKPLLAESKDR
jgi:putative transposase